MALPAHPGLVIGMSLGHFLEDVVLVPGDEAQNAHPKIPSPAGLDNLTHALPPRDTQPGIWGPAHPASDTPFLRE